MRAVVLIRWTVLLAVCGSWALSFTNATQVRLVNLDEMTGRAATIFSGRCLNVRSQYDPQVGAHVVVATFKVDRPIKGDVRGTVNFRMLGKVNERDATAAQVGYARFRAGEEVILFLYGESRSGLTSPVGFGQGKFTVETTKGGTRRAINAVGNRRLLQGLPDDVPLPPGFQQGSSSSRNDVAVDKLLDLVARLNERQAAGRNTGSRRP